MDNSFSALQDQIRGRVACVYNTSSSKTNPAVNPEVPQFMCTFEILMDLYWGKKQFPRADPPG